MSPKHWDLQQRKSKPDKEANLARLKAFYGDENYKEIFIGPPYVTPLGRYKLPINFYSQITIAGGPLYTIPFTPHARLKCQNCGLFNRGTLCPPRLSNSFPQFETIKLAKKWITESKVVLIFIWRNDGTRPWKIDWDEVAHIEFLKVEGRRLKGVEHASAKALTKVMKDLENEVNDALPKGSRAHAFIPGHCDICGRYCPLRDYPKAKCNKGGMPSMESIGIDVYKLLDEFHIDWKYPVGQFLTQVTMLVIRRADD